MLGIGLAVGMPLALLAGVLAMQRLEERLFPPESGQRSRPQPPMPPIRTASSRLRPVRTHHRRRATSRQTT